MFSNLPDRDQRPAQPGERCACGRQAVVVIPTDAYGEVGHCGRTDNPDPVMPCPFCGAAVPHRTSYGTPAKCPAYVLAPPGPHPFDPIRFRDGLPSSFCRVCRRGPDAAIHHTGHTSEQEEGSR